MRLFSVFFFAHHDVVERQVQRLLSFLSCCASGGLATLLEGDVLVFGPTLHEFFRTAPFLHIFCLIWRQMRLRAQLFGVEGFAWALANASGFLRFLAALLRGRQLSGLLLMPLELCTTQGRLRVQALLS